MERIADSSNFVPTLEQIPAQVKLNDLQVLYVEIAINGCNACAI